MKIIRNILDSFHSREFEVAPNKKLKTISAEFKKTFELTLVFYKGAQIADTNLTLAALNQITSKKVIAKAPGINLKGSTKIGDAEKMFDEAFGLTVQIKDKSGKILVPNNLTIGEAAREEYKNK